MSLPSYLKMIKKGLSITEREIYKKKNNCFILPERARTVNENRKAKSSEKGQENAAAFFFF